METIFHDLDIKGKYRLKLAHDRKNHELRVTVDSKSQPWPRLVKALEKDLLITSTRVGPLPPNERILRQDIGPTDEYALRTGETEKSSSHHTLVFSNVPDDFKLKLNNRTLSNYHVNEHGELVLSNPAPLTCSEVRRTGTFHNLTQYEQPEEDRELIERAKKAVTTDFHTHSSGQISPEGLIKVALDHDARYPVELLELAGIDMSFQKYKGELYEDIERVPFPPLEVPGLPKTVPGIPLRALNNEDLEKLKLRMAMPGDRQSTYSEMENDAYRFRYPLSKKSELLRDTIKQMAREYVEQGISYAEIASVGWLDKPALLPIIHEAMHEIENDPALKSVKLRYMVGIPRSFQLDEIRELLDKTKILADSPYVTGIDLLGYEINKTQEFANLLDDFCAWANEHKPGFNIRVHAGENDKNRGNVEAVLDLALKYPNLHFRIGHGVHGMTKEAFKKARQLCEDPNNPRLTIESNPDSVIALNNIDCVKEIPFEKMVANNIPFVIGSDSAGTYGTSADQLGLAAYYAGLDEKGFDMLEKHQKFLVKKQRDYGRALAEKVPNWSKLDGKLKLVDRLTKALAEVKPAVKEIIEEPSSQDIARKLKREEVKLIPGNVWDEPGFKDLTPVLIVGASGGRWREMTPTAQRESAIAFDMLAHALDPMRACFVQGRTKTTGLSYVLNEAIEKGNDDLGENGKKPYYTVGALIGPTYNEHDSYRHLTHLKKVGDKLINLTDELINIALPKLTDDTLAKNGVVIASGGAAFTRDIILKADQREGKKNIFLFSDAKGASAEKAKWLDPEYRVENGKDIIRKLYASRPDLFRPEFDINRVDELYAQSAAHVQQYEYGYESPVDPKGQVIENIEVIKTKQRGQS